LIRGVQPGRALEHGCGFGRIAIYLADRGWDTWGVDFALEGLVQARSLDSRIRLLGADVRSLPVKDEAFDCAVSIGVVEHLKEGPHQALAELRRVLKPGGRALITVPFENSWRRFHKFWPKDESLRHGHRVRHVDRLPEKAAMPDGFYQFSFRRCEFEPLLKESGFLVRLTVPYAIPYGFADTSLGSWAHDRLLERFGNKSTHGSHSPEEEIATVQSGRAMFPYLRSAYDETDATVLSRLVRRTMGPIFAHMMAYFVVAD
jgi:SAM-dependent methyltransferase